MKTYTFTSAECITALFIIIATYVFALVIAIKMHKAKKEIKLAKKLYDISVMDAWRESLVRKSEQIHELRKEIEALQNRLCQEEGREIKKFLSLKGEA